jgi:antitoxin (DNA-binding transcriptional repressor) of toxin-antitoxin stability system
MNALTVNATDFSRSLSEFLNQVQYKGQVLDIERGKRVVARVSPVPALSGVDGFPLAQLDELMARGPQLAANDRKLMARDVQAVRGHLKPRPDPWAS